MGFLDSAFNAFSGAVDSAVSAGAAALSDPTSAFTLSNMAPWAAAAATYFGTQSTNNTARSLAAQQQAFSAQQASTIYQRGAADLAAAGINPILAYGSPASMGSYTQPNIQPSLALATQAFNSALDAHSSSSLKYSQQHLTSAQAANEPKRGRKLDAETSATSAHDVNTREDTLNKIEKRGLLRLEQQIKTGELNLQKIQGIVMQSQAYLNSASAKHQLSGAELQDAHANLARVESILKSPSVRSVLEHPDLHQSGATAGAVSDIGKPLFDLMRSIPGRLTINTGDKPSKGTFDSLTNTWRK